MLRLSDKYILSLSKRRLEVSSRVIFLRPPNETNFHFVYFTSKRALTWGGAVRNHDVGDSKSYP